MNMQIYRNDIFHAADDRIAAGKYATIKGTSSDRHDPFRVGRRVVGAQQRFAHILRHRSRNHQDVGMAGRSDKAQAEAFEIIEGVAQRMDFQFAAIAGAGIDFAD